MTGQFSPHEYSAIQHGYAATVHKSQGMTVDECYVLASPLFDRHTTYVAMTRHKHKAKLYAAKNDFRKKQTLFAALSKDSDNRSTLDFEGGKERTTQKTKLSLTRRLATACKNTLNRIRGKDARNEQKPQLAAVTANTRLGERDAILQSRADRQTQSCPAAPEPHKPPSPIDMPTIRDQFLQQAAKKRRVAQAEQTYESPSPVPDLER